MDRSDSGACLGIGHGATVCFRPRDWSDAVVDVDTTATARHRDGSIN